MSNHLFDGLLANADPARQFAEIPGHNGTKTRYYTYQHVQEVSSRFANVLVEWGLKPGDRVAVQVPKSIEALMLYLATIRAGGIFLPLNTGYTANEVEYFIADAAPRIFICAPEDRDAFSPMAHKLGTRLETLGVWTDPNTFSGSLTDAGKGLPTEFDTYPAMRTILRQFFTRQERRDAPREPC